MDHRAIFSKFEINLDLGAGAVSPDGFVPLGNINGTSIYPLPHADGSVSVIRASHVLEHFNFADVAEVLKDWVRALKPGGRLKIAVPDFDKIAEAHVHGEPLNVQGYVMGGQIDEADFHKTVWNRDELRRRLAGAGLVLLREWTSELDGDCASLPISLNIEGTKPYRSEIKVSAAMSVPRLGFMDNFGCCIDALVPLGIRLRRQGGAFWGQALTNCLEVILDQDAPDAVLTLDYDTVFTKGHVAHLMQLMLAHPEAHAIAALQSSRHLPTALFTKRDDDGEPMARVPIEAMSGDLMKVSSAHFGLTLIRADRLRDLPKPWFHATPSSDGQWHYGDDHIDEDINFGSSGPRLATTCFSPTASPWATSR